MLNIERTKDMINAENLQWDYKGLTFLDNNSRQNFSVIKEKISVQLSFVKLFSAVLVFFSGLFSVIFSVISVIFS